MNLFVLSCDSVRWVALWSVVSRVMYFEWYGVCSFVVFLLVDVFVDYGALFHVCCLWCWVCIGVHIVVCDVESCKRAPISGGILAFRLPYNLETTKRVHRHRI